MNPVEILGSLDKENFLSRIESACSEDVVRVLARPNHSLKDLPVLLSNAAAGQLPKLAMKARELTLQRFGRIIQFYAPVYLSNECENHCVYCGFNKKNSFPRTTLSMEDIEKEYKLLKDTGMDSVLLLTGEAPGRIEVEYVAAAVRLARKYFTYVALEIYPMETGEYARVVEAGAHGLTIYQETYDQATYKKMHPKGKKSDYARRVMTPDRAFNGGMRKVGLGFLLGLSDWRVETLMLAHHASYLQKQYWMGELTLSFPRIQPFNNKFKVPAPVSDREFIHLISALRILFPDTGFVLSTREPEELRDKLTQLCVTQMSAGSKTNPGGYNSSSSEEQFAISDDRNLEEMMAAVKAGGYEPVLKDWDTLFTGIQKEGIK